MYISFFVECFGDMSRATAQALRQLLQVSNKFLRDPRPGEWTEVPRKRHTCYSRIH